MGRRADKLRYLLRLLAPPRDWLIHYYSLDSSTNLWLHYALHPLKLAYHLIKELLNAGAGKYQRHRRGPPPDQL
jgi:hypothetical protein